MIINSAEELRTLTDSFYANADFTKIENILGNVEIEIERVIGKDLMEQMVSEEAGDSAVTNREAVHALKQAIAYMAVMRYNRLNDLSHETSGRKAKIDRENEARPFEWQLARDDRAHLEEYYRALDRMLYALQDDDNYSQSALARRMEGLIVSDGDELSQLTGVDSSPWLYLQLVPYLDESQRKVATAYGDELSTIATDSDIYHAAQMCVALGALIIMGRRHSLRQLPYGLMSAIESNGGGNTLTQPAPEVLKAYMLNLMRDHHYWLNEMRTLRDEANEENTYTYLQEPDNSDKSKKYLKL